MLLKYIFMFAPLFFFPINVPKYSLGFCLICLVFGLFCLPLSETWEIYAKKETLKGYYRVFS